jgi:hypothetical protein
MQGSVNVAINHNCKYIISEMVTKAARRGKRTLYKRYVQLSSSAVRRNMHCAPTKLPKVSNTIFQSAPIPQKCLRHADYASIAESVSHLENSGAYIGKVMRPIAVSPTTSGKFCKCIVVKTIDPLNAMAVIEVVSSTQVLPDNICQKGYWYNQAWTHRET